MESSIKERVIQAVARSQNRPPEEITLDTKFEEIGMNSLDALALLFDFEEEFNVAIPNEEAIKIRDVRQAVVALEGLLSRGASESGAAPAA